jgi:hypothetical protein
MAHATGWRKLYAGREKSEIPARAIDARAGLR